MNTIGARGHDPDFNFYSYREEVFKAILCSSFSHTAVPGTGLPRRVNHSKVHHHLKGPVVLELVHLTDIGVSALKLERVRQDRDRRAYLDRVAQTTSSGGQALREVEWLGPKPEKYPRKCLKLFLSDSALELQAIELEPLPLVLGDTPMGTKVGLSLYFALFL
jgi:hypothetical protein